MVRAVAALCLLVLLLCAVASPQQATLPPVPRLIRYNGSISQSDGTLRTGVVGVMFSLYRDQQGGAALWTELQNVMLDASGNFTVLLGSQHADGVPAELFTSNEARWLGIQVEADAEQPRALLVSVPYALKAGDAETLGGHTLQEILSETSAFPVTAIAATTLESLSMAQPIRTNRTPSIAEPVKGPHVKLRMNGTQSGILEAYDDLLNTSLPLAINPLGGNVTLGTNATGQKSQLTVAGLIESIGSTGGFRFPDGTTQTTMGIPFVASCSNGQVLGWSGVGWGCTTVSAGGGISSIVGGNGVTATGSTTVTLGLDSTVARTNVTNTFTGDQTVNGNLVSNGNLTLNGSTSQIVIANGSKRFILGGFSGAAPSSAANENGVHANVSTTASGVNLVDDANNELLVTGTGNTALGLNALQKYATLNVANNTGIGYQTLFNETLGQNNVAVGANALYTDVSGNQNTAIGFYALYSNQGGTGPGGDVGKFNTAVGSYALHANTTGNSNIALGQGAGSNLTSGNDNIYIGSVGPASSGAESSTIRIGTSGKQTDTYLTGNVKLTGTGNGIVFPDGTKQTTAGTGGGGGVSSVTAGAGLSGGTITSSGTIAIANGGVTNAMLANPSLTLNPGSGLTGGGTVPLGTSTSLGLMNCSSAGQVLQWNGSAWACSTVSSGGGVTSITAGTGLTGGTITGSGTIAIDTSIVPRLAASNAFAASQTFNAPVTVNTGSTTSAISGNTSGQPSFSTVLSITNSDASTTSTRALSVSTAATGSGSIAVDGRATAATSGAIAVRGQAVGDSGIGVYGVNTSTATTSTTIGVRGEVSSTTGVAGMFNNTAGGMILTGLNNGAVKFSVDGSGTVKAATYQDLNGNPISSGGGSGDITAVIAGTGLGGGAASGDATLSLDTSYTDGRYLQLSGGTLTGAQTITATGTTLTTSGGTTGISASGSTSGVSGTSYSGDGVYGFAGGSGGRGVYGSANANMAVGVSGYSSSWYGVSGQTGAAGSAGVYGVANVSSTSSGVYGTSSGGHGIHGDSSSGIGVYGTSSSMYGVYGTTSTGYAGYFDGRVTVNGTVKASAYQDLSGNPVGNGDITDVLAGTGLSGGGTTGSVTLNLNTTYTDGRYLQLTGGTLTAPLTVSGGTIGVSATGSTYGVSGSSGAGIGVRGSSTAAAGMGVYGEASNGTNAAGVYGYSYSGYGLWGNSSSQTGIGVFGNNDNTTASATPYGVLGQVNNATGIAGVFNNNASGWILSGRSAGLEKFTVDGDGTVTAVKFSGDGSLLTNLPSTGGTWGSITGTLSSQTDLQTALNAKLSTAGGTLTGTLTFAGAQTFAATQLTGSISDARLSTNVPLKAAANTFSAAQSVSVAAGPAFSANATSTGNGMQGSSSNGYGVFGTSTNSNGVYGSSTYTAGVYGLSTNGDGVYGQTNSSYTGNRGVHGVANISDGIGVQGEGYGVGVYGVNPVGGGTAIEGVANLSTGAKGVYGHSTDGTGVYAESTNGNGLIGVSNSSFTGAGVVGINSYGGYAGKFTGKVDVNGALTKASGSFKIDHPLDPANKYLYHSFVESPDMKNVYDGVAVLDKKGEAWVELPEWFEALNKDFRYQLTAIEAPGPNLFIARKISRNRFKIAGGKPGAEVSWQVTGTRRDAWANDHRIPLEEDKGAERGSYLYPQGFGQTAAKPVGVNNDLIRVHPR